MSEFSWTYELQSGTVVRMANSTDLEKTPWYSSYDYITGDPCLRAEFWYGKHRVECVLWKNVDDDDPSYCTYSWTVYCGTYYVDDYSTEVFEDPWDAIADMMEFIDDRFDSESCLALAPIVIPEGF